MELSSTLVKEFASVVNDTDEEITSSGTAYGTVVSSNGRKYVMLDGGSSLTAISEATDAWEGDRVIVTITNHTATVTSNLTSPASGRSASEVSNDLVAYYDYISANYADIEYLSANYIDATTISSMYATIEYLQADFGYIDYLESKYINTEELYANFARVEELEAEYADIQTLFANYASIETLEASVAYIESLFADYAEITDLYAAYARIELLEAGYADIRIMFANYATIEDLRAYVGYINELVADYATIENLTALVAYIDNEYVNNSTITELLAGYATVADLNAVSAIITNLNTDVANIVNLLAGEAGVGILETIHLTVNNAVIDEAVITEALIETVLADIIKSNVIYTDQITIKSEDGGITVVGNQVRFVNGQIQFYDSDGTVRAQFGQDASGNFTFILYDETGEGILLDTDGIHASAVPDGLIVDSMVADNANIAASKLDISDLVETLNDNGQLILTAEQITIGGGTLDYVLTDITQQISDIETLAGVDSVENYYALSTNPDNYPPLEFEDQESAVLGIGVLGYMVLGVSRTNWTTTRLAAGDGTYLWFVQKIIYTDGHVAWTTPTLITDDYIRTSITTQQTELEVVQGQIQAKVWLTDIETAVDSIGNEINTISEQYALLTVNLDEIDARLGQMVTTIDDNYTELYSHITSLTLEYEGISLQVSEVSEKTSNALTDGVPYYAVSSNPDYYPPHEVGNNSAVLGKAVLGYMVLGVSETNWTTEQPKYEEGQYIWICYLRTRLDGSTYWTEPTLLVDSWARQNFEYMSEQYAQIVIQVDSILAEVVNVQSLLTDEYSTTSEMRAAIELAVEDSEASILIVVSDLESQVNDDFVTMSNQVSSIETSLGEISLQISDFESKTANAIVEGVPYYAMSDNAEWYPEDWTTEQPVAQEGQYVWIRYLRTRVDGSTYWTEPTLLTDEWERLSYTEMSNKYTQLVLDLNSALLEVYDLEQNLNSNYMTTNEAHAYIKEVANAEYTSIIEEVSNTYINYDTLKGYYTIGQTDAMIKASADSLEGSILSTVNGTYATQSSVTVMENSIMQYIGEEMASLSLSVRSQSAKYYVSSDDFPDGWQAVNTPNYGTVSLESDTTFGTYYEITRTASGASPAIRYNIGSTLPTGTYHIKFKAATLSGYESSAKVIYALGTSSSYSGYTTDSTALKSDQWTTINATLTVSSTDRQYVYVGTTVLNAPLLVKDIELCDGSGSILGSSAEIVLSTNGREVFDTLDLENVRQAFADDASVVTITAGQIAFLAGTLVIDSDNLKLSNDGDFKSISNNTTVEIFNGIIGIYKGSTLDGYIMDSIIDGSNSGGITISASTNSDYIIFGQQMSSDSYKSSSYFAINYGGTISGFTERFIFSGSMRITSYLYFGDSDSDYRLYPTTAGGIGCNGRLLSNTELIAGTSYWANYELSVYGKAIALDDWYTSSDTSLKKDIEPLNVKTTESIIDNLNPISFKYKDKPEVHFGLTYQNVVDALEKSNINPDDTAIVEKAIDQNGDETGVVAYQELIGLLIYEVQQLKKQVAELQQAS